MFNRLGKEPFQMANYHFQSIYFYLRSMFIRKRIRPRPNQIFYFFGTSFLFAIGLLLIKSLIFDSDLPSTLIAPYVLQNNSNSCHSRSIFISGTHLQEARCYPLLINFADGCCKQGQKSNCLTGIQYGIRQCLMLNKRTLERNPDFVARNKKILQRKRGAGYWLWKPYIIYHELYLASEGDIIIYSDAAVDFVANISHLIKLTEKQDVIVFELTGWKVS